MLKMSSGAFTLGFFWGGELEKAGKAWKGRERKGKKASSGSSVTQESNRHFSEGVTEPVNCSICSYDELIRAASLSCLRLGGCVLLSRERVGSGGQDGGDIKIKAVDK